MRLLNLLWKKHTPPLRPYLVDDRLRVCRAFLRVHADKKMYVITRTLATKDLIQSEFPNAIVMTLQRAATGWSDLDPNAYMCCTCSIRHVPTYVQLMYRLRGVLRPNQLLIYYRNTLNSNFPKLRP